MKEDKIVNGTLIIEQISFRRILVRRAVKNNDTSSKISLPKDFEGKEVFIILPVKGEKIG